MVSNFDDYYGLFLSVFEQVLLYYVDTTRYNFIDLRV